METMVRTKSPLELRKAGLLALTAALGRDGAGEFLRQWSGTGNFVEERRQLPKRSLDEIFDEIFRLQAEVGITADE